MLSGLIHCQYITEEEYAGLIHDFKLCVANGQKPIPVRHGAVLGLCSFISAFPHHVPEFLPGVYKVPYNLISWWFSL